MPENIVKGLKIDLKFSQQNYEMFLFSILELC